MHGTGCLLLVQILLFCRLIVSHLQLVPSAIPDVHGYVQVDYCHPLFVQFMIFFTGRLIVALVFPPAVALQLAAAIPCCYFCFSFLPLCLCNCFFCLLVQCIAQVICCPPLAQFLLCFSHRLIVVVSPDTCTRGEGHCSTMSLSRSSLFRNRVRCCSVWNRWLVACANIACLLVVASPLCTCGHTQDDYCQPLLAQSMIFYKYIDCFPVFSCSCCPLADCSHTGWLLFCFPFLPLSCTIAFHLCLHSTSHRLLPPCLHNFCSVFHTS